MRLSHWIAAFAAVLALAPALARAQSAGAPPASTGHNPSLARSDPSLIQPDPAIVRGVLPNGLRYAILRHAGPAGAVSIRLAFDVGAYDEADDELEAAHLVEHMTFRGAGSFAGSDVASAFQAQGVGFGRDQNAETDLYSTVYRLDLPRGDDALLDLSFRWLRDVADGARFDPAAVEAEKGVVLAEREMRLSAQRTVNEQVQDFQAGSLRSVARMRTVAAGAIAKLDAHRLEAFYDRWYRPENAVLVVVGDLPPDQVRERIERSFGSWTGRGPAGQRTPYGRLDEHRGEEVFALSAPDAQSDLQVCSLRAAEPKGPDDVARLRRTSATDAWVDVLDRRFADAAATAKPPFFTAQAHSIDLFREMTAACVDVVPIGDDWRGAMNAVQAEIRRLGASGPTQAELDSVIDEARSRLRGARNQEATRPSAGLATAIATDMLNGDVSASPAERFRAFDEAVEQLGPDEVKAAFQKAWSGSGPLITVIMPKAPTPELVRTAWAEGEAAPLPGRAPTSVAVQAQWAYNDFGRPGRVVQRDAYPGPDFVRLRFANGVVLNFKHTSWEANSVTIRVRFGSGRREIAKDDYIPALLGTELFQLGGLGRHTYPEMVQIFRGNQWDASLAIGDDGFVLTGKTYPGGLKSQLQILAAFVSDPGFRPDLIDPRLPGAIDQVFRLFRTTPVLVLASGIRQAVAPDSPLLPPKDKLLQFKTSDFKRLVAPALTTAPLEVSIVGDVDEETAARLMASTFGALPARRSSSRGRPDAWFLRFPEHPPALVRITHEGSKEVAIVGLVWPLYVASPARRREEIALNILGRAFSDALRQRLRAQLGEAYDPDVAVSLPDDADQGELVAVVGVAPSQTDSVAQEIRRIAERFARGDLPDMAVEDARAPLLSGMDANLKTNARWVSGLDGSAARDPALKDFMSLRPLLASVTAAEVRKAAADWLVRPPVVVIAEPAPAAGASGGVR